MGKSGNQVYFYAKPHPFTTPSIEAIERTFGIPADIFPHEQLLYSGPIIENIMFHISLEYEFRGFGRQEWKAYKSSTTDFDTFTAGGSRDPTKQDRGFAFANTLQNYPSKWFPLYIRDIQESIEALINDSRWPDTVGSLMARIFFNNTTHTGTFWTKETSIPNEFIAPAPATNANQGQGLVTLEPRGNVLAGNLWAFPADSDHVAKVVPRMGIDWIGHAYVNRGPMGVLTSDEPGKSNFQGDKLNRWPRSVVGKRRVQEGITIIDGFIEERDGASVEGIDSVHMPAASAEKDIGRPTQFRQIASEDAPLPGAIGKFDPDSGYSWFAHHPLALHQCRYQPPLVERWDNKTKIKDYVENVYSNLTPNLPWYFSQEVEKVHFSDWGGWLIQGFGGLNGPGLFLKAYPDPQHNNLFTDCPFSVFYPPRTVTCSCLGSNTAYAIWTSSAEPIIWNQQLISNPLLNSGGLKFFGPATRLRIEGDFSLGAGTGSKGHAYWAVGIRTARISSVNLQPFILIMGQQIGSGDDLDIYSVSMDVNIMDAIKHFYPTYNKSGRDAISAILISVNSESGEIQQNVPVVDGPGGASPPNVDLGCALGISDASVSKIYLFEPEGSQDTGGRLPPNPDPNRRVQSPPDYNLPIISDD